ncbi:MAG: magnesium/cobalt transporter CorA, partial [Spirochaetales bacterium]|nr:magnesium/cobalt transporter CorA [Spirochaetales bacterium]
FYRNSPLWYDKTMKLIRKDMKTKIGRPPGTLITEEAGGPWVQECRLYEYDPSSCEDYEIELFSDLSRLKQQGSVSWLNVTGLTDGRILEWIGREFDIHPLVLEDIQNTGQRPKIDDYGDYLFITCRMLSWNEPRRSIESEQVSFLLGTNFLISFQERPGDVFDIIRNRIAEGKGRIRSHGADYLMYALMDAVVDHYYLIVEELQSIYEELEERILRERPQNGVQLMHTLRTEVVTLRRAVWPLRDIMNQIRKGENSLITQTTEVFFRDVSDHIAQVVEADELLREMLSGVLDYYQSAVSNDMNAVMKVLTIIATIFIPLTFIAGVYGMNFHWMPELLWKWGYPAVLGLMAAVAVYLIIFFRKKKWL